MSGSDDEKDNDLVTIKSEPLLSGVHIILGTTTGLVKRVNCGDGTSVVVNGVASQNAQVTGLTRGRTREEIVVAMQGAVVVLAFAEAEGAAQLVLRVTGFGSTLVGADMVCVDEDQGAWVLACVTEAGVVHLVSELQGGVVVDVSVAGPAHSVMQVSAPVERFCVAPDLKRVFAVGGKNNRLTLWDAKERKRLYQARNPPDDWLGMSVPTWVSGIAFATTKKTTLRDQDGGCNATLAVITRYHELQLYDTSEESLRPSRILPLGEEPLTSVCWSRQDERLVVGNAVGVIWVINVLQWTVEGRLTPSCLGSVRDIAWTLHSGQEYIVASGLDRFVYCYNVLTRALARKMYVKQKISRVLPPPPSVEGEHALLELVPIKQEEAVDSDEDADWGSIPVVEPKKRSASSEAPLSKVTSTIATAIAKVKKKKKKSEKKKQKTVTTKD